MNRLIQKNAVSEVKKNGRKVLTDQFVLLFSRNNTEDACYAIHIRKRFGNAVERNRAKRVFRASLLHLKEMIRGLNVIIVPRRGGKGLCTAEVVSLLEKCLAEAGLSRQR